ncbi:MAG: FAD:protein FMN transferase [Bacteroidales bacterium]|nr:FAD:protein FMN transferase [Bacteroidales bacterium]
MAGVKAGHAEIQRGIEAILEDIDTTLSGYNKGSLLSRLNAGDTIVPNAMLCKVYDDAYALWQETDGALDCAAGPLYDLWGFGFKGGEFPDAKQVAGALAVSGTGRLVPRMEDALRNGRLQASWLVRTDESAKTSREKAKAGKGKAMAGVILNFNAIAQGYSCDTVASYLDRLGVKDMLVDIGEIWCRGLNASGKPWRIGIDRPTDGNDTPGADLDGIWESAEASSLPAATGNLTGQGLVTSGNYRKFFIYDGKKYPHTIDPRTGYPVSGNPLLSATIVAPTAELADAYATYCMVIGLDTAKQFIDSRPDLEGYLIYDTPDGMAEWRSAGFNLVK